MPFPFPMPIPNIPSESQIHTPFSGKIRDSARALASPFLHAIAQSHIHRVEVDAEKYRRMALLDGKLVLVLLRCALSDPEDDGTASAGRGEIHPKRIKRKKETACQRPVGYPLMCTP